MNEPKPLYLFVGRPASGKETQARLLAEKLGAEIFMTGAAFREMVHSGTPLGERIKERYEKGLLMPPWVAVYLFQRFLFELPEDRYAVFEGTGRAKEEAESLNAAAVWLGRSYTVFNLTVRPETVVERSASRLRDAADAAVEVRLAEYDRSTVPAIEYFRSLGAVIDIDGERSIEAIHDDVMEHVHTHTV